MKKMIAATGFPYNEGCPVNTDFPDLPVTCILTPKVVQIAGDKDLNSVVEFGEVERQGEDYTQIIRFRKGGVCFTELKVLLHKEDGITPWKGRVSLTEALLISSEIIGRR